MQAGCLPLPLHSHIGAWTCHTQGILARHEHSGVLGSLEENMEPADDEDETDEEEEDEDEEESMADGDEDALVAGLGGLGIH